MPLKSPSYPPPTWHRQQGLNLIELLLVLLIAGILLGVVVPGGQAMLERAQLRAATNEVYSALLFARNEAVRLRKNFELCFVASETATGCSSNATSLLGVFEKDGNLERTFAINDQVTPSLVGVDDDDLIEFQKLGNRDQGSGGAVYLELKMGDNEEDIRRVESCFNGRVVIRENAGVSEC